MVNCLRQAGTNEEYVKVIQDMFLYCLTVVRFVFGEKTRTGIQSEYRSMSGVHAMPFPILGSGGCDHIYWYNMNRHGRGCLMVLR